MKLRDLDFRNTPLNQAHQDLGIPPVENQPLHPIIHSAVWFAAISLIGLLILGLTQLFGIGWHAGLDTIRQTLDNDLFWQALLVGLLAQTIDGALGMAYGITSTSFLLATGVSPAVATASVHMAEVFTTGASGIAHAKFGNVNKSLFLRLLIPGILGSLLGAYAVTQLPAHIVKPIVTLYLLIMGIYVLRKAFRKQKFSSSKTAPRHVGKLALLGGFLDSSGGGGWGPVVTTTLVGSGQDPRSTIGSVNFAEFFLTFASATALFVLVDENIWHAVAGLVIGGLLAAPFAAYFCKKLSPKTLLIVVGTMISLISLWNLHRTIGLVS